MTVYEVIEAFARGMKSGGASKCKSYPQGRLRIEGNKLYNYDTVIAYWFNDIMLINGTKYSKTTSKHQNRLMRLDVKKLVVDEDTLYEVMRNGDLYVDIIKDMLKSESNIRPKGYYEFKGNILIYEGGDEVYDMNSGTYYPEWILDDAEYIGPIEN